MKKNGFTMIELIFVIVILGILASIAIPKFAVTRDDAIIAKGRSEVGIIKNAIKMTIQNSALKGNLKIPEKLDNAVNGEEEQALFTNVLDEPIISSNSDGGWMKIDDKTYEFILNLSNNEKVDFFYDNKKGTFTCDINDKNCLTLIK